MQVAALKGELDKQRVKAKADRKDLDALSELSAVHSEVFMDVQKKLESHGQVRALKRGRKCDGCHRGFTRGDFLWAAVASVL